MIVDEVKSEVANALATIPDLLEEAVSNSFTQSPLVLKGRIRTTVYNVLDHRIPNQIRTAVLVKKINKHVGQCFEAIKATEHLASAWLCNDEFLTWMASFV